MGAELSKLVAKEVAKSVCSNEVSIKRALKEIGTQTKFIAKSLEINTNLKYQKNFPAHVLQMLEDEIQTASDSNDGVPHYFAVYVPGSELLPAIRNQMRDNEAFIGCFDDLNVLCMTLLVVREDVRQDAVLHVLVPSAHEYRIENTIHVPHEVLPLRVHGQTNQLNGKPYVHAKLDVEGDFEASGVGIVLRKREKLAAVSAGTGAGLGAGLGVAALGTAALFMCPVTAPAAVIGSIAAATTIGTPVAAAIVGKGTTKKVKADIQKKKVG